MPKIISTPIKTSQIQNNTGEMKTTFDKEDEYFNSITNKFIKRIGLLTKNFERSAKKRSQRSTSGQFNKPNSNKQLNLLIQEIKYIKHKIEELKEFDDKNQNDKARFSLIEANLETLQKQADDQQLKSNVHSETVDKSIESIIKELDKFNKELDDIKQKNVARVKNEKDKLLVEECINDLRAHRFSEARTKLLSITRDSDLNHIVKSVYDAKENNFQLIIEFVKGCENYNRRVLVYEALKYEMETNHHRNPFNIIRLAKALNEIINEASDPIVVEKSKKLTKYFRELLKNEIQEALKQQKLNKQLINELYKFDRELWVDIITELIYEDHDSNNILVIKYVSNLASIPQLLACIEVIVSNLKTKNKLNIEPKTIIPLLQLDHLISSLLERTDYWNLSSNEKTRIKSLSEELKNVRSILKMDIEKCLTNNKVSSISDVINKLFIYDKLLFREILTESVRDVHQKMNTDYLIDRMYDFYYTEQIIYGLLAVLNEKRKTNKNYNINSRKLNKLKFQLANCMAVSGCSTISPQVKAELEASFPGVTQGFTSYINKFKDAIIQRKIGPSELDLADELFSSSVEEFEFVLNKTIDAVYSVENLPAIILFVEKHRVFLQQLLGYFIIFDKMIFHGHLDNPIIFKLATIMRDAKEHNSYQKLNSEIRSRFEKYIQYFPNSVKNIIFASEVCIKNIKENKYLHLNITNSEKPQVSLRENLPANEGKWLMNVELLEISNITNLEYGLMIKNKHALVNGPGCLFVNESKYDYLQVKVGKSNEENLALQILQAVLSSIAAGIGLSISCPWYIEPKGEYVRVKSLRNEIVALTNKSNGNLDFHSPEIISCNDNDASCELWDIQDCSNTRKNRQISNSYEFITRGHDQTVKLTETDQEKSTFNNTNLASINNLRINTYYEIINDVTNYIKTKFISGLHLHGTNYTPASTFVSSTNLNSSILLLDVIARKLTGEKYVVPSQTSATFQQIQADALNILDEFQQMVETTARQHDVPIASMDLYELHKTITDYLRNDRYLQIPDLLHETIDAAYGGHTPYQPFVHILHKKITRLRNM